VLGNLLDSKNSGGASSPRATATGGTWGHAPPQEEPKKHVDLKRLPPSFLSSPAVTCNKQKTHTSCRTLPSGVGILSHPPERSAASRRPSVYFGVFFV
jgi:hypothetical protein